VTHPQPIPGCEGWWYAVTRGNNPAAPPGGQQTNGPMIGWVRYGGTAPWESAGRWRSVGDLQRLVTMVDGADLEAIVGIVRAVERATNP